MSTDVVINPPVNWTQPASSNPAPGPVDLTVADPLVLNATLLSIKPAGLTSNGFITTANQAFSGMKSFQSIQLVNTVNRFSTDGTLAGNLDSSIPTERAVKTYVDGKTFDPTQQISLTNTTNATTSSTGLQTFHWRAGFELF